MADPKYKKTISKQTLTEVASDTRYMGCSFYVHDVCLDNNYFENCTIRSDSIKLDSVINSKIVNSNFQKLFIGKEVSLDDLELIGGVMESLCIVKQEITQSMLQDFSRSSVTNLALMFETMKSQSLDVLKNYGQLSELEIEHKPAEADNEPENLSSSAYLQKINQNCPGLVRLKIHGFSFSEDDYETLKNFQTLHALDINMMSYETYHFYSAVNHLKNLVELKLKSQILEHKIFNLLKSTSIKSLDISSQKEMVLFKFALQDIVINMPQIEVLRLANCRSELNLEAIKDLNYLREFHYTGQLDYCLEGLESVEEGGPITFDVDLQSLKNHENLRKFYLDVPVKDQGYEGQDLDTRLTISKEFTTNWPLEELSLTGNIRIDANLLEKISDNHNLKKLTLKTDQAFSPETLAFIFRSNQRLKEISLSGGVLSRDEVLNMPSYDIEVKNGADDIDNEQPPESDAPDLDL